MAAFVEDLIGRLWTNRDGARALLTLEDILVVAPYNAQVRVLAQRRTVDQMRLANVLWRYVELATSTS